MALTGIKIDWLINNAGILIDDQFEGLKSDPIKQQLAVNAVAPLMVTEALLDNLHAGSKVAVVSSRMGSIADNSSGGYYGYRMSKAALNAGAKSMAIDLKTKNIAVGIYHPGFVQTDMVKIRVILAPMKRRVDYCLIEQLTLSNSGVFHHSNGDVLPW